MPTSLGLGLGLPFSSFASGDGGGSDTLTLEFLTTASSESVTIPCQNVGVFNATIDWGDGSTSDITAYNDPDLSHTFAVAGTQTVSIKGTFPNIYFNNSGDKDKLIRVVFGSVGIVAIDKAFYGCSNLQSVEFIDNLSGITSLVDTFFGCSSLIGFTGHLDTSSVTNMQSAFRGATSFNGDIGYWDVSSVTNMQLVFRGASVFNQDIGDWDFGSVTNASNMFFGASSFNQDVGGWDTSSLQNAGSMFRSASAFDRDLGGWDVSSLASAGDLFRGIALSTVNYDSILISWSAQSLQTGVSVNFGSSTYTSGGAAEAGRNTLTTTYSWSITDGGAA